MITVDGELLTIAEYFDAAGNHLLLQRHGPFWHLRTGINTATGKPFDWERVLRKNNNKDPRFTIIEADHYAHTWGYKKKESEE